MRISHLTFWSSALLLISLISVGCSGRAGTVGANNQQPPTNPSGELRFQVPDGWVVEHPSSSMRVAQYKLPKVEGDSEDASLVLYYFGQGQGGSVEANIDRWIGQMQQPDGSSGKDKAKTEILNVNGLKVTTVDARGTYSAEMTPGKGDLMTKNNYRLRGAIVETPKGAYFAKLVGPDKTVTRWEQQFNDYVNSFSFK